MYLIGTHGRASLTGELWIISLLNDLCAEYPAREFA
jgi:hypothetical protein